MPSCSPILSSYFVQFVILSSSFSSKHFPANDSLIRALVLYVHFLFLGALNHVCMVCLLVMIINDYNTTYFCFSWLNLWKLWIPRPFSRKPSCKMCDKFRQNRVFPSFFHINTAAAVIKIKSDRSENIQYTASLVSHYH